MSGDASKASTRTRRTNSGWVAVKVSTRRSERVPRQNDITNEFRVDEHGALMVASASSCTITHGEWTAEADRQELAVGRTELVENPGQPQWKARIHYDQFDHSFWLTPLASCPAVHAPASAVVPSRRRDMFVQLGERGSTAMSWPLQAGDGFRIGHTYVVVLRALHHAADGAGYAASGAEGVGLEAEGAEGADAEPLALTLDRSAVATVGMGSGDEADSDDGAASTRAGAGAELDGAEGGAESGSGSGSGSGSRGLGGCAIPAEGGLVFGNVTNADGDPAECCFCYEPGTRADPLMRACGECRGSVQYVHLSCLRRWSSPQGSGRVPAQCPTCKRDLRPDVQEKLVVPPALLLEVYWSHHRQRRCQWVSFAARNTATIGKMDDNDVVIPDHTVSRRHARIEYTGGKFILHDTLSSRGTFAPIRSPLKLAWGQEVCLTVGKSSLVLTPKLSWLNYLTRWLPPLTQHGRRPASAAADAGPGAREGAEHRAQQQPPGAAARAAAADPVAAAAEAAAAGTLPAAGER